MSASSRAKQVFTIASLWAFVPTLAVGLLFSFALYRQVAHDNEAVANHAIADSTTRVADKVIRRIELYQYGLRAARGAMVAAEQANVDLATFRRYIETRDLEVEFPGARGFGFIRKVGPEDEPAFIAQMQAEGRPEFQVSSLSAHEGDRYIVEFIEPEARNQEAVGFDIASDRTRRIAADAAMVSGAVTLTGPITLLQAPDYPGRAFLLLLPVYDHGDHRNSHIRAAELYGWSFAPLLAAEVWSDLDLVNEGVRLTITDVTDSDQGTEFFNSLGDSVDAESALQFSLERRIYGRRWHIQTAALPLFMENLALVSPELVFALGGLISLLVAGLAMLSWEYQVRRRDYAAVKATQAAIVDSAIDAIIGESDDGLVVTWNPSAERMFGHSSAEAIGRNLNALIVPDSLVDEAQSVCERVKRGERVPPMSTERLHASGYRIPVSIGASPLPGPKRQVRGIAYSIRDITAQNEAEKQIRQLNASLEQQVVERTAKLESARDQLLMAAGAAELGIWTWRISNNTVHWNERMNQIYEMPAGKETYEYDQWRERVDPADIDRVEAELRAAVAGEGVYAPQFRVLSRDGRRRTVQAAAHVEFDADGTAVFMTGVNQDVTERVMLEDTLREAKVRADAANQAKTAFLANMSHEIRTPMNAIMGMMQLLQMTALDLRQVEYVARANAAARTMLGLLNDVLDFSKIEAGKMSLDPHPFQIDEMFEDIGVVLAANVGDKDLEVLFDLDAVPAVINADPLRLKQVITNLAGNAIKFTPAGEVVVTVSTAKGTDESAGGGVLKVSVRDTGIGIAADQLERIFQGFEQAEASTTRRFGGTGLGLAISQRLVEMMGGKLDVRSEPNVGSTFAFSVPYLSVDDEAGEPVRAEQRARPLEVLIIDDNSSARKIHGRLVNSLGWESEFAVSGLQALDRIEARIGAGKKYDLLLVDWQITGIDGFELCRRIREFGPRLGNPWIILVTAKAGDPMVLNQPQIAALVDGMLFKPLTASAVERSVATLNTNQGNVGQSFAAGTSPQAGLAGLHLLVAEDNLTNQLVVRELLVAHGAKVTLVDNGVAAVAAVSSAEERFDAVLMDIQMPLMDGYEATRAIRRSIGSAELPIIAITANALASDRESALVAGMNDHVSKPFDRRRLVSVLSKHLKLHSGLSNTAEDDLFVNPGPARTKGDPEQMFDIAGALDRFEGNTTLYASCLRIFAEQNDELLAQVQGVDLSDDGAELMRLLHALKGIAGTLGASRLSQLAEQAESLGHIAAQEHLAELLNVGKRSSIAAKILADHYDRPESSTGETDSSD